MKILRLFAIVLMLMNSTVLLGADYQLKVVGDTAPAGRTVEVKLELTHQGDAVGFYLDIPLPDGFELISHGFETDRFDGHTGFVNQIGDLIRVMVLNEEESKALKGDDGIIATFHLQTPEAPGIYALTIVDGVLSDINANPLLPLDVVGDHIELIGNEITILDTEVIINQTVPIHIQIDNYQAFYAFQADIELPGGFTYVEGSAELNYTDRAVEGKHEFRVTYFEDTNVLSLFSYSDDLTAFRGEGGVIAAFEVEATPDPEEGGDYELVLVKAIISDADGEQILTGANNGWVTVFDHVIMDITDVDALTNEIVTVGIEIDASYPFTAFEATIVFDEEVVFQGLETIALTDRLTDHQLIEPSYDAASRTLHIRAYSDNNTLVGVGDGHVVTFDVKLPNEPGDYLLELTEAIVAAMVAGVPENIVSEWKDGHLNVELEVVLAVADTEGCSGELVMVDIHLHNSQDVVAFETYVKIPEGLELADDVEATLSDRADGHTLRPPSFDAETRILTLFAFAEPTKPFAGTEGVVVSFALVAPEVEETTVFPPVSLHNSIASNVDGSRNILTDEVAGVITIHPAPEVEVTADGDLAFCDGGMVVLTASEAVEYLWNNGETTRSITVTESGEFYVTITDVNGCSVTSDPVEVTVWELPEAVITPDGDLEFCEGGSVELTASEGAEYLWSNGAETRSIVVTESGVFNVTVFSAEGCSATSDDVEVIVHDLPEVTCPDNMEFRLHADDPVTLTGGTPAGGTYSGRGVSDGVFNPWTAGVGTWVITYKVTDPDTGCENTCTFEIEVINDTSVPEVGEMRLSIYPNPAQSILNIRVENDQISEIRMIDMLGQVVYSANVQDTHHEISVNEFKNGIYFVQVLTSGGLKTHRVQVTK